MMIVKYRKIFYVISGVFVGLSIAAILFFGLTFGIDFTGGSILEVSYPDGRPEKALLEERLNNLPIGAYSLRPTGENGYLLRTRDLAEGERLDILRVLSLNERAEVVPERFNSIGPAIGKELRNKAFVAIAIVVLIIIMFVAFVFRKVSGPTPLRRSGVNPFMYGVIAIIALLHDVIIPVGLFALLGVLVGAEIDVLFVMALLAILGYSVNDTIVVMDRVRENLRINREFNRTEDFELTVGKSLQQTFTRSINTSLTTIFVLFALFFLGSPVTQNFALVLITGVIAGTYSSLALATPLLVTIERWKRS